jgi:hypothetical protein
MEKTVERAYPGTHATSNALLSSPSQSGERNFFRKIFSSFFNSSRCDKQCVDFAQTVRQARRELERSMPVQGLA